MRRAWRRPIHFVASTRLLADCACRSTLMPHWPITVIPNLINLNAWAPCDQAQARALLGLPAERPLVLLGAIGGGADPRKGADLLLEALQCLRSQVAGTPLEQLELVTLGQSRPVKPSALAGSRDPLGAGGSAAAPAAGGGGTAAGKAALGSGAGGGALCGGARAGCGAGPPEPLWVALATLKPLQVWDDDAHQQPSPH